MSHQSVETIELTRNISYSIMRVIRIQEFHLMAKTFSFAGVHMTVAFAVGWAMSGNPWVGGALALVEPAVNTVAYHLHEKLWKRIQARRPSAPLPA
ncbi:MAG: DUF2061 domain-containing protein [Pseudoxanthomonas suwonensis]|nr:DUF2061 domain-containing protein [Pseudoxanthomonas suwonensis]